MRSKCVWQSVSALYRALESTRLGHGASAGSASTSVHRRLHMRVVVFCKDWRQNQSVQRSAIAVVSEGVGEYDIVTHY